jgi:hypothetical protein
MTVLDPHPMLGSQDEKRNRAIRGDCRPGDDDRQGA